MDKTILYVVVADGYWYEGYGSKFYLLGVFTSEELAEKCVKENTVPNPYYEQNRDHNYWHLTPEIIKVERDKTYPLINNHDSEYMNANYIGGYME